MNVLLNRRGGNHLYLKGGCTLTTRMVKEDFIILFVGPTRKIACPCVAISAIPQYMLQYDGSVS